MSIICLVFLKTGCLTKVFNHGSSSMTLEIRLGVCSESIGIIATLKTTAKLLKILWNVTEYFKYITTIHIEISENKISTFGKKKS